MSKPIRITEDCYELIIEDLKKKLASGKMSGGVFNYSYDFAKKDGPKAKLCFTPDAYLKTISLVNHFGGEVGWHGVIERGEEENEFIVSDILVYPQLVTGSTVNTDQEEYQNWCQQVPDETFNKMHFHGHSHVNFSVSPSTVDMEHRNKIVSQLGENDFYVFAITNKKGDWSVAIYDMPANKLFETEDVDILVIDASPDLLNFGKNSEAMVKQNTYNAAPARTTALKTDVKERKQDSEKKKSEKSKDKLKKTAYQTMMDEMDAYEYDDWRRSVYGGYYPYY